MKLSTRLVLSILFVLPLTVVGLPAATGDFALPAGQEGNLLQNPGFEGAFHAWSSIPEVQVADNWTPWWHEDAGHNPAFFRPEYKRAQVAFYPKRVRSGESAQQWFTFHASHLAGMYQQVFNVTPGQQYRFTIWAQVWSSLEDNPDVSVLPANPHLQIGIDPTGNWNPASGDIIWSGEASMSGVIDQWGLMSVEATAQNDTITVFMRTVPEFANKHNDMYWDDASVVSIGTPVPPPTNTPLPATDTPIPTDTPPVTHTPIPPTATNTPSPTVTAEATETRPPSATPTATKTVLPSETPTSAPPTGTPETQSTPTAQSTSPSQATEVANSASESDATEGDSDSESEAGTGSDSQLPAGLGLVVIGIGLVMLAVLIVTLVLGRRSG